MAPDRCTMRHAAARRVAAPLERPARWAKRLICHEPSQNKAGAAEMVHVPRSARLRWPDFGAGASPRAPPLRHNLSGPRPPRSPRRADLQPPGAAGCPQPPPDPGLRGACLEPVGLCSTAPVPGHRTSGQSSRRASSSSTPGSPGASSSALSRHGLARLSWCTAMYAIPRYSCAFLWRGSAFMALL